MSLSAKHVVPATRSQVWDWHSRQGALARLTPPFAPITPVSQAESLANGTTILAMPAGLKWIARHDLSNYRRGYLFTDVCTSAPIKMLANWRHVHEFADHADGTLVTDTVNTRVPGAALKSMFAYRQHQLINDLSFLERISHLQPETPLTVAITGSRGLVGRALSAQLTTSGHKVIQLVRGNPKPGQREWDLVSPDPELLAGVDVLIHLAGEPIYGRFNNSHKQAIRDSRIEPTRRLAELVSNSPDVSTMISASAVGYYGADRGEEELDESADRGEGFLADVVSDWEEATTPAAKAGKRVVRIRTGAVISGGGGLLPLLKALFSTGLGGSFGDGNFWFSWIALDDLTDIIVRSALDPELSGSINATAPNPVLNRELTSALSSQLHRPAIIPIPTLGPAILLGKEGAKELALADQRVIPQKLIDAAHTFRYPTLAEALAHELGGEELCEPGVVAEGDEVE
ncbi:TIGR01777 family oxidoreductase [Corynebacterium alimapuense]|uniref:TIGR01777 family protein n=1 Tax=Corynebacterium alimapuense TaxID=1576874 RepID=A0A3M8K9C5_9CORY|nr:TIGR01777 family oxidoreductase [Corynebacterium alimapuense]RNE49736.1 TIGR01777 family protein [Corynebacterium alimapuense]